MSASRMHIPAPHSFTHKRPTSTIAATGRKVSAAPTTVEEQVPGMMSPAGTAVMPSAYGQIEEMRDTIYLEAIDDDGSTRVIRAGDLLIDEDTDDVWKATGPGNTFQNPSLFASDRKVKHHVEITVERVDPEARRLA